MNKNNIIKTNDGYFFDTETGYYLRLSDEICDVIDAPSSDFQEEGERWETVSDLIDDTIVTNKQFEKFPNKGRKVRNEVL